MADVIFIVLTIVFFVLCAAFVVGCDRLIGPGETPVTSDVTAREPGDVAA